MLEREINKLKHLNSVKLCPNVSILYAYKSRIVINDSHALFCQNCVSNAHTLKNTLSKGSGWGKEILLWSF